MFAISPEDVRREALSAGVSQEKLRVPPVLVMSFCNTIVKDLSASCGMKEWSWIGSEFTPYAVATRSYIGKYKSIPIALIVPPMGASPMIALCDEFIHFGTQAIFLLCASWSVGKQYLDKGEIQLPTMSIGLNGTSPHYGNEAERVACELRGHEALARSLDKIGASWKSGGVGSCEALYRITSNLLADFRSWGCLSVDNGEVGALYSLGKEKDIPVGVLLQPYLDLTKGWRMDYMDEAYMETCRLQAKAALIAVEGIMSSL
jgi:uridine phosphorylase